MLEVGYIKQKNCENIEHIKLFLDGMVDNKHNPATYFTNATTSDRASALLRHQTSHLPFPRHGKNGVWACNEYAELFQGTHQCPHTRKKALGSCCSAGKMQEESGCTRDT